MKDHFQANSANQFQAVVWHERECFYLNGTVLLRGFRCRFSEGSTFSFPSRSLCSSSLNALSKKKNLVILCYCMFIDTGTSEQELRPDRRAIEDE